MDGQAKTHELALSRQGTGYFGRIVTMALFLLPVAELGGILAVAIHEILGHGLAAVMLGGRFSGFALQWDGMGWAWTALPPAASQYQRIAYLAAGVIATTVAGLVFLAAAVAAKKKLFLRMAFVLLAATCLLDGLPYVFWNSYHPVPPGDMGRIFSMAGTPALRWALMIGSGIMFPAAQVFATALIFQGVEQWAGFGRRLEGWRRVVPLALLGVAWAGWWLMFDWNQLAPGVGKLPIVVGVLVSLASVVGLYRFSLRVEKLPDKPVRALPRIIAAWAAAAAAIAAVWLFFEEGVFWG